MKSVIKEWLANRQIRKEAWLYATIEATRDVTNHDTKAYYEGKHNYASKKGYYDRRRMYYYDKMKQLGGKF